MYKRQATKKGCNLHDLADYAVIQINDTHPSMVIPELIRLLTARGIDFDEAAEIVSKVCAYTCLLYTSRCVEETAVKVRVWRNHFRLKPDTKFKTDLVYFVYKVFQTACNLSCVDFPVAKGCLLYTSRCV